MKIFSFSKIQKKKTYIFLIIAIIYIDRKLKSKKFLVIKDYLKNKKIPVALVSNDINFKKISQIIDDVAHRTIGAHKSCLRRSLLLWWVLHSNHVDCDLCIGVRMEGNILLAHAWVEINHIPLNDDKNMREAYSTIAMY